MREVYQFFEGYHQSKGRLILYITVSLLVKGLLLLIPYLTKQLIDDIQYQQLGGFKSTTLLLIGAMILFSCVLSLKYYLQQLIEIRVLNQMKQNMLVKLFNGKNDQFISTTTGEIIQKIFNDTETIRTLIVSAWVDVLIDGGYVVALIFIMFRMNVILTLLLLVLIPIFLFLYKIYAPRIEQTSHALIKEDEQLKSMAEELMAGRLDIKVNRAQSFMEHRIHHGLNRYFKQSLQKTKNVMQYDYFWVTGVMNLATLLIYCFGGYLVFNQQLSIGALISFNLYFSKVWSPIETFMELTKEMKVWNVSFERVKNFLLLGEEPDSSSTQLPTYTDLVINDLTFSYEHRTLFNHLNLVLAKGEKVGIKGGNGAGKSTLASFLIKLRDVYEGNLHYSGVDYTALNARAIREHVIYLPPKSFLFRGTVLENIALTTDPSSEKLDAFFALEEVQSLLNVLKDNQRDLNTTVQPDTPLLSSGEQKIIQLLRGMYLDGEVYILDEPLNYVDGKYKRLIIECIRTYLKDKSVIIISHDEEIFACCDRVYRLDKQLILEP